MIEGWVNSLGWALIDVAWQGLLVGALYAVARWLVRDARARLGMGYLALLALAVLPVLNLILRLGNPPEALPVAAAMSASTVAAVSAAVAANAASAWSIEAWLPWLVAAWALGVTVHATRLIAQWRGLRRMCAAAVPVSDDWLVLLAQLRRRMGISARVRLLHGAHVVTPMLVGVLRPTILLPSSLLLQLPRAQVELILIHELGHLHRLDTWFNLLQTCLDTLLFFHPALHWISRKVREDRELCCDELVLARGGDRMLYARTLLAMAEAHHRAAVPAPALGAAGGLLLQRVERIVDRSSARPGRQMPAVAALLAVATLLWALKPVADEHVLRDLGLPPLAASGVAGAIPALAGLRFSVADAVTVVPAALLPQRVTEQAVPLETTAATLSAAASLAAGSPLDGGSADVVPLATATGATLASDVMPAAPLDPVVSMQPSSAAVIDAAAPIAASVQAVAPLVAAADAATAPAVLADTLIDERAAAPHTLRQVAPDYPSQARLRAIEGVVILRYEVDAQGRATEVMLEHAEPAGVFEKAARRALAQWRFQPTPGETGEYRQQFDFRLDGADTLARSERCHVRIGSRLCRATP